MAKSQLPAPPMEILTEFLCGLSETVSKHDNVLLILRGSYLLKHWFGDDARPAADIDLECFERSRSATYERFGTAMNHAKSLCMYAAETVGYTRPNQAPPRIAFNEADVPEDGTSLWEYGTPGERCYAGWVWNLHKVSGILQIDIAQAGACDLEFISTADIELVDSGGAHANVAAYTPEMLLAAKLSWIVRGLTRQKNLSGLKWNGAHKDLFDAHLLVTKAHLRTVEFEKAMLAVAAEDNLDWSTLDTLAAAQQMEPLDYDLSIWDEFQRGNPVTCGPVEMLGVIGERVGKLLANLRQHVPFLLAINAEPVDEVPYLIYADWLQERSDPRSDFLRFFVTWFFAEDTWREFVVQMIPWSKPAVIGASAARQALRLALQKMSSPWLYHVFGSAERFRKLKQKIEA